MGNMYLCALDLGVKFVRKLVRKQGKAGNEGMESMHACQESLMSKVMNVFVRSSRCALLIVNV